MSRSPAGLLESLIANCRPQPAIPALLVLMLTLMFAVTRGAAPAGGADWTTWVTVAGLLASCGLAIAAGFCSLFPPLSWIVVAWLGLDVIGRVPGAAYTRATFVAGVVAAVLMIALQTWRVRTGRFVPTIGAGTAD
jgi:hypothetical protein